MNCLVADSGVKLVLLVLSLKGGEQHSGTSLSLSSFSCDADALRIGKATVVPDAGGDWKLIRLVLVLVINVMFCCKTKHTRLL